MLNNNFCFLLIWNYKVFIKIYLNFYLIDKHVLTSVKKINFKNLKIKYKYNDIKKFTLNFKFYIKNTNEKLFSMYSFLAYHCTTFYPINKGWWIW